MAHALLSPSAAKQWMSCPPSIRFTQGFPDETSDYAEEGTAAHELAEIKLNIFFHGNNRVLETRLKKIKRSKWYSAEMEEYVRDYVQFCVERYNQAVSEATSKVEVLIEEKIDVSMFIPEGFGTGDFGLVYFSDGEVAGATGTCQTIVLIDLKYGKGVPVHADNNPQLKIYSAGLMAKYGKPCLGRKIELNIFQPRIDNSSTWVTTGAELHRWCEEELKPKAKAAFDGDGQFKAGDHCQFCKGKAVCKARAEFATQLAKWDFLQLNRLDNSELAEALKTADIAAAWIKDLKEYTLSRALQGETFEGFKLVEGVSRRSISDDQKAIEILKYDCALDETDFLTEPKLRGIGDLEKLVGKHTLSELFKDIIVKPKGAPTLAPESDKREPYNSAEADFADIE